MTTTPQAITIDQLGPDRLIVDVREQNEWDAGHIAGAVHLPMASVIQRMSADPLVPAEPLVVTCKAGGRAGQVAQWLNANGFPAVVLTGGMLDWQAAGKPMVCESDEPARVV